MASGERKSCIWRLDLETREWKLSVTEVPKFGIFNDMSVRCRNESGETRFLLCDWRKAKLWTLTMNEQFELTENRSTKMKRVKGQEWIVQGPTLAALDEQFDILIYDGSGKIFLFDGESYKFKKIVADVGRGEVSAIIAKDGWLYALCRYRLCIEAYMYKEYAETHV